MTERIFGKDAWVEMFRAVGLDDATMARWHHEFESRWPDAHERFLGWLGLPAAEVDEIRRGSRAHRG
jgi:hypothetical protein